MDLDPHSGPDAVLDLLYRSLEGYPTGQKVERQTRCVTVRYADRMHVDVTPAVRLGHGAERVSHIFHAHPDKPVSEHFHVPMNAYGFAEWYRRARRWSAGSRPPSTSGCTRPTAWRCGRTPRSTRSSTRCPSS
ncbi:hypothetical protein ACU4GA_24140 [Methylobacterium oryzae CBMB20]